MKTSTVPQNFSEILSSKKYGAMKYIKLYHKILLHSHIEIKLQSTCAHWGNKKKFKYSSHSAYKWNGGEFHKTVAHIKYIKLSHQHKG